MGKSLFDGGATGQWKTKTDARGPRDGQLPKAPGMHLFNFICAVVGGCGDRNVPNTVFVLPPDNLHFVQ